MPNNRHYHNIHPKEHIKCVGLGCSHDATITLKIRYLNRMGHFCEDCRRELVKSEFIISSHDSNDSNDTLSFSGKATNKIGDLENRKKECNTVDNTSNDSNKGSEEMNPFKGHKFPTLNIASEAVDESDSFKR